MRTMIRRTFGAGALAVAFSLALAPAALAQPIEMKIADSFPKGHVIYDSVVNVLIPALEEGGKIKVQYFPANQLGAMKDVIESVRGGVADIAYVAPGVVAGRMPVTNVMSLPGEFPSGEQLAKVFMKMVEGPLKREYDKLGIKIITASGTPPYQIFTVSRVVKGPADAKGLKLRGGGGDADDFMRDLGISVINMPASQMYESLQRGVIDGVAYLHATAPANHLEEVTKYATEGAPLMSLLALYFVDQKKWDSWSPEIKGIVARAGQKLAIEMGKEYDRRDKLEKAVFLKAGGKIHTVTAEERKAWQDSYKGAAEAFIKKQESRSFDYARAAYTEMQKLKAETK
jgi:TRAP-type C4-dicarboxylate transport system substrate-binding protein